MQWQFLSKFVSPYNYVIASIDKTSNFIVPATYAETELIFDLATRKIYIQCWYSYKQLRNSKYINFFDCGKYFSNPYNINLQNFTALLNVSVVYSENEPINVLWDSGSDVLSIPHSHSWVDIVEVEELHLVEVWGGEGELNAVKARGGMYFVKQIVNDITSHEED